MRNEPEICCPRCAWRPRPRDRWLCRPGCGAVWNTFWTRALCPGCGHQWLETACLSCGKMSPHEKWYHHPNGHDESTADAEVEREALEKL